MLMVTLMVTIMMLMVMLMVTMMLLMVMLMMTMMLIDGNVDLLISHVSVHDRREKEAKDGNGFNQDLLTR